eukprot:7986703-Pyramimonas_sp.AAC.1
MLRSPQWMLRAPQWMLRAPQWMLGLHTDIYSPGTETGHTPQGDSQSQVNIYGKHFILGARRTARRQGAHLKAMLHIPTGTPARRSVKRNLPRSSCCAGASAQKAVWGCVCPAKPTAVGLTQRM